MAQTTGPLFAFSLLQQQIRHDVRKRIKAGVSEKDLVRLAIPTSLETSPNTRFQRIHAKEFRFDGKMYDIVRQERRGDTTYYACIYDDAETALFAGLHRMMQDEMQSNPERRRQQQEIRRMVDALYLAGAGMPLPSAPCCAAVTAPSAVHPPSSLLIPPKPPPELLF
ncbi:MAG: hypothetical protein M5R41_06035 [Bacteroidia bacterium]|nr:hypothetical protein [Bacteroidia bacterium]